MTAIVLVCHVAIEVWACTPFTASAVFFRPRVEDELTCVLEAVEFFPPPPPGYYVRIVCGGQETQMKGSEQDA